MIKPLLEKSNQSMLVAEMLIKQHHYSSTVTRAYYSCFQYILHILIEKLGHTHDHLRTLPRDGIHSQAQYLLESTLVQKVGPDKRDYKWFQKTLPEFKKQRVLADYHGDPLNSDSGYDAIRISKEIMNTLRKYY